MQEIREKEYKEGLGDGERSRDARAIRQQVSIRKKRERRANLKRRVKRPDLEYQEQLEVFNKNPNYFTFSELLRCKGGEEVVKENIDIVRKAAKEMKKNKHALAVLTNLTYRDGDSAYKTYLDILVHCDVLKSALDMLAQGNCPPDAVKAIFICLGNMCSSSPSIRDALCKNGLLSILEKYLVEKHEEAPYLLWSIFYITEYQGSALPPLEATKALCVAAAKYFFSSNSLLTYMVRAWTNMAKSPTYREYIWSNKKLIINLIEVGGSSEELLGYVTKFLAFFAEEPQYHEGLVLKYETISLLSLALKIKDDETRKHAAWGLANLSSDPRAVPYFFKNTDILDRVHHVFVNQNVYEVRSVLLGIYMGLIMSIKSTTIVDTRPEILPLLCETFVKTPERQTIRDLLCVFAHLLKLKTGADVIEEQGCIDRIETLALEEDPHLHIDNVAGQVLDLLDSFREFDA